MGLRNDLDIAIGTLVYGTRTIVYKTDEFPTRNALNRLPELERIDLVCQRYKFWILEFAEKLANEPNSGYAVLALLNSYFDMIAQLSGLRHPRERVHERVTTGLKIVFPELNGERDLAKEIYERLRNPIAHMGGTKDQIILIDRFEEAITWGKYHNLDAIVINPRIWAKRIIEHFDNFAAELLDSDSSNDSKRAKFLERISDAI
jgi:hypothetical protein